MRLPGCVLGWLLAVPLAIASPERIVVGGEEGYEPYEAFDAAGEPEGFNVDLMQAIGEEMGIDVDFRLGSWEAMRTGLIDGEIDVLGMFVSEERAELVSFANPHVIVHHRIFIPANSQPIGSIADLEGKQVIVQNLAYTHEYLARSDLDIDLITVDDDSEGLELLAQGRHDAAVLTEHRSRHTLRERDFTGLAVSGPPVLPIEYAFAVRNGNQPLLDLINTGLERVTASGRFDRIYDRWLHPDDLQPGVSPDRATVPLVWMLLGVLLIVTLLLASKLWKTRRDRQQARKELAYLADHDALTGLLNRHAFERNLGRILEETNSEDRSHAVLNINIDQFRLINDHIGHAGADRLLAQLAKRLTRRLPNNALAARMSGDEFAVLLPGANIDLATAVGEAILSEARGQNMPDSLPRHQITVSIGAVAFHDRQHDIARLLRRADCALLAAKEDGGDRVHAWHKDDRRLAEKLGELRWVSRIQSALHDDRLRPYWQAILPVSEDAPAFIGIELLVRLISEDGSIVPAGQFMSAAERYFLSPTIDRWMIDYTLVWLERHPDAVSRLDSVNINLSGRSLGNGQFLKFLESRLGQASGVIERITLEVTETALIANLSLARSVLNRLHRMGCRIALDDFGIGLSSMKYLKDLPVDFLKIDGSFVRDIDHNRDARKMIEEINRMGQSMSKITVAECVETETIREKLEYLGIDLVQGYLFGRPAPLETLEEHLDNLAARRETGQLTRGKGERK